MSHLTPEKIKTLRDQVYEDSIDNGYAATIMLDAFDLIETLREAVKTPDLVCLKPACQQVVSISNKALLEVTELKTQIEKCQAEARKSKTEVKGLKLCYNGCKPGEPGDGEGVMSLCMTCRDAP